MAGYTPPKPDGQRRRRNATVAMTQLPAGGRKGAAPPWPKGLDRPADMTIWRELWKTPAAAAWERLGYHRAVARYALLLSRAEAMVGAGKVHPQVLSECRQMEDRLGLNPLALLRLRWEVSADELAERRVVPAASRPKVAESR